MNDLKPDLALQKRTKTWGYLFRVLLSFVIAVLIFDFIWSRLSSEASIENSEQYWQDAFLSSLESLLEHTDPSRYDALASELSHQLGLGVNIDSLDQVHLDTTDTATLNESVLMALNGETYLLATYPRYQAQARIGPVPDRPTNWHSTAITLGFYALIGLLIWVWIRPVIRGLDQLSEATHRFAQNYQEPLPDLKVGSPVKELADSIESMAEQIRTLIQTQVELTGGLSHEIRTPLARIKFALATARNQIGEQSQFDSIEQDLEELEHLVEAMLDYSRLQQTQAIMQWQSIDADPMLNKLSEKFSWRTSARIEIQCQANQNIECDTRLMPMAISNLLANATRYARDQIEINCQTHDNQQIISVSDDGPGISEEQRVQAVLPFKKNTGLADQSDGFGLGLAIVNRIAKLHNGGIELTQSRFGGLEVSIFWPLHHE